MGAINKLILIVWLLNINFLVGMQQQYTILSHKPLLRTCAKRQFKIPTPLIKGCVVASYFCAQIPAVQALAASSYKYMANSSLTISGINVAAIGCVSACLLALWLKSKQWIKEQEAIAALRVGINVQKKVADIERVIGEYEKLIIAIKNQDLQDLCKNQLKALKNLSGAFDNTANVCALTVQELQIKHDYIVLLKDILSTHLKTEETKAPADNNSPVIHKSVSVRADLASYNQSNNKTVNSVSVDFEQQTISEASKPTQFQFIALINPKTLVEFSKDKKNILCKIAKEETESSITHYTMNSSRTVIAFVKQTENVQVLCIRRIFEFKNRFIPMEETILPCDKFKSTLVINSDGTILSLLVGYFNSDTNKNEIGIVTYEYNADLNSYSKKLIEVPPSIVSITHLDKQRYLLRTNANKIYLSNYGGPSPIVLLNMELQSDDCILRNPCNYDILVLGDKLRVYSIAGTSAAFKYKWEMPQLLSLNFLNDTIVRIMNSELDVFDYDYTDQDFCFKYRAPKGDVMYVDQVIDQYVVLQKVLGDSQEQNLLLNYFSNNSIEKL